MTNPIDSREKLVEILDRAIYTIEAQVLRGAHITPSESLLSSLENHGLIIVPKEPTEGMVTVLGTSLSMRKGLLMSLKAALAISPFVKEG